MIVAHTNAVLYALLPGDHHAAAEVWWSRDSHRVVAALLLDEVRNVLLGFVRRNTLTLDEARSLHAEVRASVEIAEIQYADDLLGLAHSLGLSGHDVVYLALARSLGAPLLTADKRLLAADPATCCDVRRPPAV